MNSLIIINKKICLYENYTKKLYYLFMKKSLLIPFLAISSLFAFDSNIQASYAIGIFHENGKGENIQHKKITDQDYNGTCFSKIVIFGDYNSNSNIEVKIGDSIGHFINKTPVFNDRNIRIGYELTFKHYTIRKGLFQVKIDNKLYDSKVFVK